MGDYVVPPVSAGRVIAVTRGMDCTFTLRHKDKTSGEPIDWNAAVFCLIDIDKKQPLRVDAVVSGADAAFRLESGVADLVRQGTAWRAGISTPGDPSLEKAIVVGYFERNDGGES